MKDHHRMRAWDGREYFGIEPSEGFRAEISLGGAVAAGMEIELCTGLRDKNEVLIYEGDILSTVSPPMRKQKSRLIHRVLFENGGIWVILEKVLEWSGFKGGTPLESQLLASVVCNYEVAKIGNIHQNPKLLN